MVEGDLCLPAVNELRYAGRRLVDAWIALALGNESEARAKINDAKFDCYRARHDSIDAICSKIAKDIEITVDTFGVGVVVAAYGNYAKFAGKLFATQSKIEGSRGDRKNRSAIYSTIETVDIVPLIEEYREMRLAEPIMVKLFEEKKLEIRDKKIYEHGGFWVGVAGAVLGIAGLALAYLK